MTARTEANGWTFVQDKFTSLSKAIGAVEPNIPDASLLATLCVLLFFWACIYWIEFFPQKKYEQFFLRFKSLAVSAFLKYFCFVFFFVGHSIYIFLRAFWCNLFQKPYEAYKRAQTVHQSKSESYLKKLSEQEAAKIKSEGALSLAKDDS